MNEHSLIVSATYIVRLFLWDLLTEHMPSTWAEVDELSDMPIIPTQEQPEEQTSGKPYIVYTYDYMSTSNLWQFQNETAYFRVISQSAATIAATTKLMIRVFNRLDDSARDINAWIHSQGAFAGGGLSKYATGNSEYDVWIEEVKNFQFKYTRLAGVTGTQPAASEAGRVDSIISIELHYVELDHAGNRPLSEILRDENA